MSMGAYQIRDEQFYLPFKNAVKVPMAPVYLMAGCPPWRINALGVVMGVSVASPVPTTAKGTVHDVYY